tara:strand:+ start:81 stop:683 length:603 start_codon:yes stop_codon:yes gene_type:complete
MIYSSNQIKQLDRITRLKLINSICGIRGVHLIGSFSSNKRTNLAIFSSVVHVGSNPSIIGFITRPNLEVRRDTYNNIIETNYYTINSIEKNMVNRSHQTSGKYDANTSEFDVCQLNEEYIHDFPAPFVSESKIKLGLKHVETLNIKKNNTRMILGEIKLIDTSYSLPISNTENFIGIVGLNSYYEAKKVKDLDYVRVNKN